MSDSMWILVTAGRGPGECQIAVKKIAFKIFDEANALGLKPYVPDHVAGEHGWLSALIAIEPSEEFAASWSGTVLWICPSPIRETTKRKNWFVSVSTIRYSPMDFSFKNSDLKFDTYRSSGPGGQHVNVTDSAVRVTHIPTGLTADAQEERSQYRNKSLAIARLHERLSQQVVNSKNAAAKDKWHRHDELERGNPIKTYRGPNFDERR